ncbi:PspC domain-containing protein [Moraxella osloensis]|uniref:PspC domain-containing protein n=1 Tax=Faucicola osloensis TaxID=34062 RepID=UPI002005C45A|nr:PspC domain-containing protein [Moraxella osloensis]MCK6158340.1 PspC domain-containing protein [Moraxella osloensis]
MSLVASNPYRMLGLINPVTSKNLTKRIQDIETFAEFGKVKTYPLDLVKISPFERNLKLIKEATRQIESNEDRLLNALFWFYQLDTVDEMAIEALAGSNFDLATKIWQQQIKKSNNPKFSWLINLNVLQLLNFEKDGFDEDIFQEVIDRYGDLFSNKFEELTLNLSLSSAQNIDKIQVGKKLIELLLGYCSQIDYQPSGSFNIRLLGNFSNFPKEINEYADLKISQPCIQKIESVIEQSESLRKQKNGSKLFQKNGLQGIEELIYELDYHSDNYQVKNIINEYVEEAIKCSLFAFNELDDDEVALEIIDWASDLPCYGQISEEVIEKKRGLEEAIENKVFLEKHQPIIDILDSPIYSLDDAANKMQVMKRLLANIPANDENYLKASSSCVNVILSYLVKTYNESFETFKSNKNLPWLQSQIRKCKEICLSLQSFRMDSETNQRLYEAGSRFNQELADIKDIANKIKSGQLVARDNAPNPKVLTGSLYSASQYVGFNANLVRLIFIIATLATGFWPGVILYIILAFVLPKKS